MNNATRRPWEFSNRDWRGLPHPHNLYIVGDRHQADDDEEERDEFDELPMIATSVAIVVGNETAGGIPRANAELICRAVNAHDELLAACEAALLKLSRTPLDKVSVAADMLRAAIAKAKGESP